MTDNLPTLISKAAAALANATTAAEVLDAKRQAQVGYIAAKAMAHLAKIKGAHGEVIAAIHKGTADMLVIEAQANIRLADEYDAAQKAGDVAKHGGHLPKRKVVVDNLPPTLADIGMTKDDVHQARAVRDAEKAHPGIVRKTLEAKLKANEEPKRADVKRAVNRAKPKKRKASPTLDKAREIVRPAVEAELPLDKHALQQEHGISHVMFDAAVAAERARKEAEAQIDPATLSLSAQQKLDMAIRQQTRRLEAEFGDRVNIAIKKLLEETILPRHAKEQAEAYRVIKSRNGLMTRAQYNQIRNCLHPDRLAYLNDAKLTAMFTAAFGLFNDMELLLLNESQNPTHPAKLPSTVAEMMAMRRKPGDARRSKPGNGAMTR